MTSKPAQPIDLIADALDRLDNARTRGQIDTAKHSRLCVSIGNRAAEIIEFEKLLQGAQDVGLRYESAHMDAEAGALVVTLAGPDVPAWTALLSLAGYAFSNPGVETHEAIGPAGRRVVLNAAQKFRAAA